MSRATSRHIWPASLPQISSRLVSRLSPRLPEPHATLSSHLHQIPPRQMNTLGTRISSPGHPHPRPRFIPSLRPGWLMAYHHQLQHASLSHRRVHWRSRGQQTHLAQPQQGSLIIRLQMSSFRDQSSSSLLFVLQTSRSNHIARLPGGTRKFPMAERRGFLCESSSSGWAELLAPPDTLHVVLDQPYHLIIVCS